LVPTQADLEAYLTSVSSDWTQLDPTDPDTQVPFDPIAAASWVWARLEALNGETQ
jgi:hypothetical protein